MPANNNLQWFDIKEFGGLWTAGANSLMPADAAQVMSGCHPQPGGGLRAFLKVVESYTADGMDTDAADLPAGYGRVVGFGIHTVGAAINDPLPVAHVLLAGRGTAISIAGSSRVLSTPDDPALDILGDLDLRSKWITNWPTSVGVTFLSNLNAAAFSGYELSADTSGVLTLSWGNGSAVRTVSATAAIPDPGGSAEAVLVRATLDVNNGAAGHDVKFYAALHGATAWTQVGTTVTTAGVTSIAASNQSLYIGRRPGTSPTLPSLCTFVWAQVRNGISGTLAANPDAGILDETTSLTTFTDGAGRVWSGTDTAVTRAFTLYPFGISTDWYLWQLRVETASPSWSRVVTAFDGASTGSSGNPGLPTFANFKPAGNSTEYLAIAIEEDSAAQVSGIYSVDWDSTPTATELTTATEFSDSNGARALVIHQNRLVAAERNFIRFSAAGTDDFDGTGSGFLVLNPTGYLTTESGYPNQGAVAAWMLPIPPGDLLVGTVDGKIYNVQGDLSDPEVRELGLWAGALPHVPANTPAGIYVLLSGRGVGRLGLDGSIEEVSGGLLPTIWNPTEVGGALGQMAGTERYLFCPNEHQDATLSNGPLVLDHATGSWFTATHPDDFTLTNPRFMALDNNPQYGSVWVVTGESPQGQGFTAPMLFRFPVGAGFGSMDTAEQRAATWEWQSSPLRDPSGRYVEIREIQIPAYAFNDVTSTLAVTVNGTTRTVTLPAGRSIQSILFKEREENLDITVKAKSNDPDVEAPMIEAVRAGWRPGPLIR